MLDLAIQVVSVFPGAIHLVYEASCLNGQLGETNCCRYRLDLCHGRSPMGGLSRAINEALATKTDCDLDTSVSQTRTHSHQILPEDLSFSGCVIGDVCECGGHAGLICRLQLKQDLRLVVEWVTEAAGKAALACCARSRGFHPYALHFYMARHQKPDVAGSRRQQSTMQGAPYCGHYCSA